MNTPIKYALKIDSLIDMTTTGKHTGKAHKIEIAFQYTQAFTKRFIVLEDGYFDIQNDQFNDEDCGNI